MINTRGCRCVSAPAVSRTHPIPATTDGGKSSKVLIHFSFSLARSHSPCCYSQLAQPAPLSPPLSWLRESDSLLDDACSRPSLKVCSDALPLKRINVFFFGQQPNKIRENGDAVFVRYRSINFMQDWSTNTKTLHVPFFFLGKGSCLDPLDYLAAQQRQKHSDLVQKSLGEKKLCVRKIPVNKSRLTFSAILSFRHYSDISEKLNYKSFTIAIAL